jgi:hypothetical protein
MLEKKEKIREDYENRLKKLQEKKEKEYNDKIEALKELNLEA